MAMGVFNGMIQNGVQTIRQTIGNSMFQSAGIAVHFMKRVTRYPEPEMSLSVDVSGALPGRVFGR